MTIGGLGIFVFIIALLIIQQPKKQLMATVFFAPFCASSVLSFSSFILQPGHFFLFLFLGVSVFITSFSKKKVSIMRPNKYLVAFLTVAFISILISWILRIDVLVYGIGNNNQLKSSLVSTQNFTQYLYLLLGFIVYWIVYEFCARDKENWKSVVKIFAYSGLTILLIGCYQIAANTYGLPFDEIFRNTVKKMWQTKERVQATMGEASFLGQYCTYLAAIYLSYKWCNKKIVYYGTCILSLVIGVMSRSSTFLFGVVAVLVMIGILQRQTVSNIYKCVIVVVLGAAVILYLGQYNVYVQKLLSSAIQKLALESHSGTERFTIFSYMLKVGISYPIFGIGYGGGRSTDLYTNLLSTTGITGTFFFLLFIIKNSIILIENKDADGVLACILLILAFLVTSCSVPDLSYLPIWVIFGLIDARCYQLKKYVKHVKLKL